MPNGQKYEHNDKDIRFSFFPGKRRKIILDGIKSQCNAKGDRRHIVFRVRLPLSGQSLLGFPQFLASAWEAAEKEGSLVCKSSLDGFLLEGMDIEFFSQEDSQKRLVNFPANTFYDFEVIRESDSDTFSTSLTFKFRVTESVLKYKFWVEKGKKEIFCDFVPSQNVTKESDDSQMSISDIPAQTSELAEAVNEDEGDGEES